MGAYAILHACLHIFILKNANPLRFHTLYFMQLGQYSLQLRQKSR
jgi:hypothetical protein